MNYEAMRHFHCPRWNEFPDIELYMDQVISIMDKHLNCFAADGSKIVTSTMINNYVKQKIVKPPKNKKYDRVHLAYLMPVCVLKQVISIPELCDGISLVLQHKEIPEAYDYFCELMEQALYNVFSNKAPLQCSESDSFEDRMIKSVVSCFVTLQYTKYMISQIRPPETEPEPESDEKEE